MSAEDVTLENSVPVPELQAGSSVYYGGGYGNTMPMFNPYAAAGMGNMMAAQGMGMASNMMMYGAANSMRNGMLMMSAASNPANMSAGWLGSARYDNPHGGEIDTFHNRLCFDSVCKHDPEATNDLNTEWLRRSIPAEPVAVTGIPLKPFQFEVPRPDRLMSLTPYDAVSGKDVRTGPIFIENETPMTSNSLDAILHLKQASVGMQGLVLVEGRRRINDFIYARRQSQLL